MPVGSVVTNWLDMPDSALSLAISLSTKARSSGVVTVGSICVGIVGGCIIVGVVVGIVVVIWVTNFSDTGLGEIIVGVSAWAVGNPNDPTKHVTFCGVKTPLGAKKITANIPIPITKIPTLEETN